MCGGGAAQIRLLKPGCGRSRLSIERSSRIADRYLIESKFSTQDLVINARDTALDLSPAFARRSPAPPAPDDRSTHRSSANLVHATGREARTRLTPFLRPGRRERVRVVSRDTCWHFVGIQNRIADAARWELLDCIVRIRALCARACQMRQRCPSWYETDIGVTHRVKWPLFRLKPANTSQPYRYDRHHPSIRACSLRPISRGLLPRDWILCRKELGCSRSTT